MCSQQAAALMRDVYPFLVLKKDQAATGIAIEDINAEFSAGYTKDPRDGRRMNPERAAVQQTIYDQWKIAQKEHRIGYPAPFRQSNPHDHMMVNEAIDFRVDSLEEALYVVKTILV